MKTIKFKVFLPPSPLRGPLPPVGENTPLTTPWFPPPNGGEYPPYHSVVPSPHGGEYPPYPAGSLPPVGENTPFALRVPSPQWGRILIFEEHFGLVK